MSRTGEFKKAYLPVCGYFTDIQGSPFFRFSLDRQNYSSTLLWWKRLCHGQSREHPQPEVFLPTNKESIESRGTNLMDCTTLQCTLVRLTITFVRKLKIVFILPRIVLQILFQIQFGL